MALATAGGLAANGQIGAAAAASAIVKGAEASITGNGAATTFAITFPLAFPGGCDSVVVFGVNAGSTTVQAAAMQVFSGSVSASGFSVIVSSLANGATIFFYYIAVGH